MKNTNDKYYCQQEYLVQIPDYSQTPTLPSSSKTLEFELNKPPKETYDNDNPLFLAEFQDLLRSLKKPSRKIFGKE